MEKEKKKGAVTSEERNREANANPVEEALRKQWKAACTHARTYERTKASKHSMGKGLRAEDRLLGLGQREGGCHQEKGKLDLDREGCAS